METDAPELSGDHISDALALSQVHLGMPNSLKSDVQQFALHSKRFRNVWQTLSPPKTATPQTDRHVAKVIFATLVEDAVALAYPEEFGRCPTIYLHSRLELPDAVLQAILDALERNGLLTTTKEPWGDMWSSRVGSYCFAGEIGYPYEYITLTDKGKAWAASSERTEPLPRREY